MSNTFGFGFRAFKKFPELIPLAGIISVASAGAIYFMGYSLKTKPDVQFNRTNPLPAWEQVSPTETRKFIIRNDRYVPDEELEKLRKEIGSYRKF